MGILSLVGASGTGKRATRAGATRQPDARRAGGRRGEEGAAVRGGRAEPARARGEQAAGRERVGPQEPDGGGGGAGASHDVFQGTGAGSRRPSGRRRPSWQTGHRSISMPVTRSMRARTDSGASGAGDGGGAARRVRHVARAACAAAVGQQAEVADAHEALGDDVQQEAAEELVGREVHDLHAIGIGVVAPAKADATLGEGEQALVGDGDAVGVAAEVGEHVLGAGEGGFAVDDPGLLAQVVEPGVEGRGVRERRRASRSGGGRRGRRRGAGRRGRCRGRPWRGPARGRESRAGRESSGRRRGPGRRR